VSIAATARPQRQGHARSSMDDPAVIFGVSNVTGQMADTVCFEPTTEPADFTARGAAGKNRERCQEMHYKKGKGSPFALLWFVTFGQIGSQCFSPSQGTHFFNAFYSFCTSKTQLETVLFVLPIDNVRAIILLFVFPPVSCISLITTTYMHSPIQVDR
jgi:hypothetical protein